MRGRTEDAAHHMAAEDEARLRFEESVRKARAMAIVHWAVMLIVAAVVIARLWRCLN